MPYFIADLVEAAGVAPRTIREYIRRGMVRPPQGLGPAAVYDDEHLARVTTIARMRAQGNGLDAIAAAIKGWKKPQLDAYLAETDAEVEAEEQAGEGEPAADVEAKERAAAAALEPSSTAAAALPVGPRFVLAPLLPGLALMVGADASPLVLRIANEICERYGAASGEGRG